MKKLCFFLITLEPGFLFSPVICTPIHSSADKTIHHLIEKNVHIGSIDTPGVCFVCQNISLGCRMSPSVNHRLEAVKPTILVLDDDVLSLELYARELSSNYRVIVCERMEDARKCLKDYLLAAVILEPALSENDGWILLREIHSSPDPFPVIVCSTLDDRKIGLEQGADAFLVKPVLPTTLHNLIDQIVSAKSPKTGDGSTAR